MERANVVCYMRDGTAHYMTLPLQHRHDEFGDSDSCVLRPFKGWKAEVFLRCSRAIWIENRVYLKNRYGTLKDTVAFDFGQPDNVLEKEFDPTFIGNDAN